MAKSSLELHHRSNNLSSQTPNPNSTTLLLPSPQRQRFQFTQPRTHTSPHSSGEPLDYKAKQKPRRSKRQRFQSIKQHLVCNDETKKRKAKTESKKYGKLTRLSRRPSRPHSAPGSGSDRTLSEKPKRRRSVRERERESGRNRKKRERGVCAAVVGGKFSSERGYYSKIARTFFFRRLLVAVLVEVRRRIITVLDGLLEATLLRRHCSGNPAANERPPRVLYCES